MEKLMKKPCILCGIFLLLLAAVLTSGYSVFKGMADAAGVCLTTMIPSLYAMMIMSEIFVSCDFHRLLAKPLKIPAKFLFGCSGDVLVIFLFSQAAGYPVGARMLLSLKEKGQLTKRQASVLSGVSFGGGPAFLSALFAEKKADARAVFLAGFLANLLIFTVVSRFINVRTSSQYSRADFSEGSSVIVSAACKSGTALLRICAMVIMFGGIMGLADALGIRRILPETLTDIIFSFAEISRVTALFPYSRESLPLIGAALSFGGICVLMQLAAVTEGKIYMGCVLVMRIIAAAVTWLLLTIRESFFYESTAETAAVILNAPENIGVSAPLPSILLLIMTVMLLRSADKS